MYFASNVFRGTEVRYQKIEKLVLVFVITVRKMHPYFQRHIIIMKTNYLIQQVLKKLDLEGRMVSWSIGIS